MKHTSYKAGDTTVALHEREGLVVTTIREVRPISKTEVRFAATNADGLITTYREDQLLPKSQMKALRRGLNLG